MNNINIKKTLQKYIKGRTGYKINLVLWHSQIFGGKDDDFINGIYNEVVIYNETGSYVELDKNDTMYYGNELPDTPDNVKILRQEQDKMFKYLKKHLQNVEKHEWNV